MSSPASTRPQRNRRQNPRFNSVAWDKETLRRLRRASTSSGSSPSNSDIETDVSDDKDFGGHNLQSSSDDDDVSLVSNASEASTASDGDYHESSATSGMAKMSYPGIAGRPGVLHTRGLVDVPKNHSRKSLFPLIFGPSEEDLAPVSHVSEHWLKGKDVILPSRSSLADANVIFERSATAAVADGQSESSPTFATSDKEAKHLLREAKSASLHLEATDTDLKLLHARQKLKDIDERIARAQKYLPNVPAHAVVQGPPKSQYLATAAGNGSIPISLQADQSTENLPHQGWLLNLGEKIQAIAWAQVSGTKQYLAVTVRCTPEQRDVFGTGQPQYGPAFAASGPYPSNTQLWSFDGTDCGHGEYRTLDVQKAPHLNTVVGMRCGDVRILAWAPVTPTSTDPQAPHLLAVLSTDSHVRILSLELTERSATAYTELESAALTITPPTNLSNSPPITGGTQPVFTALTWASTKELIVGTSTGHIHIYDIHAAPGNPATPTPQPFFTHAIQPYYIVALTCTLPPPHHPTSYPGATYLASTSTTGDLTLTSLSHPTTHTITYPRARLPSRLLTYSPLLRAFLTVYEPSARHSYTSFSSSSTLACHHLRRFYSATQLALLPLRRGAATGIGVSKWHPSVLVGSAAGDVWAMNHARKVLVGRPGRRGRGAWIGKVVGVDWRRWREVEVEKSEAGDEELRGEVDGGVLVDEVGGDVGQGKKDLFHGTPTRKGVSRLTFGFKPEAVDLTRNPSGRRKNGRSTGKGDRGKKAHGDDYEDEGLDDAPLEGDGDVEMRDGEEVATEKQTKRGKKGKGKAASRRKDGDIDVTGAEVIFEEEQAVTTMEWNVSQQTSGWAAIGWGSGLLMVRDLSVEL